MERRRQRVAVTGAGGFVGAALAQRLAADGHDVVAVVRTRSRATRLAGVDAELLELDLERPEAAETIAALGCDAVVHSAAAGAVVADADAERLVRVNALAPFRLALALRRSDTRLITIGSSSEYGPSEGAMAESQAAEPDDVYGAAKLAGAALVRAVAATARLQTMHLRLFSVYGPGEDAVRLVPSLVQAALLDEPLELSPGAQVRDFVFVDDVVDAILAALALPRPNGAVVNVGTGVQTSVRELAGLVAAAAGVDGSCFRFGAKPYRDEGRERFSWRADTARALAVLGWRPRHTVAEGVELTVEHARRALDPV